MTQPDDFTNWFGASKIVNADGSPRVVYHQTHSELPYTFDRFHSKWKAPINIDSLGIWFTSESQQEVYGPNIRAYYLSLKNPLVYSGIGAWREMYDDIIRPLVPLPYAKIQDLYQRGKDRELLAIAARYRFHPPRPDVINPNDLWRWITKDVVEHWRDRKMAQGFDGVAILGDTFDIVQQDAWVAFHSEQILAVGQPVERAGHANRRRGHAASVARPSKGLPEFIFPPDSELVHIGTRTPPRRRPASSLECWHLSISTHPESWEHIAQLGGNPWWLLTRPGFPRFVDMCALTAKQRAALLASAQDLVKPVPVWRVHWFDDELDNEVTMVVATKQEAQLEVEDGRRISRGRGWQARPTLQRAWKKHFVGKMDTTDAETCALLTAIERLGAWDGAWWDEEDDPTSYSAPRGCIFRSKLSEWSWKALNAPDR